MICVVVPALCKIPFVVAFTVSSVISSKASSRSFSPLTTADILLIVDVVLGIKKVLPTTNLMNFGV